MRLEKRSPEISAGAPATSRFMKLLSWRRRECAERPSSRHLKASTASRCDPLRSASSKRTPMKLRPVHCIRLWLADAVILTIQIAAAAQCAGVSYRDTLDKSPNTHFLHVEVRVN